MSFSQSLLLSQPNYELFAPSWQAGMSGSQNLSKSLRNYDLERVNIAKTCDKLCLALKENSKTNCVSSQELAGSKNQCAIRKENNSIPLRAFTNIWFGTLKIYQEQVNTLFRLSKDLLTRSSNYDTKRLETCKRKSSSKETHKFIKKRRLTLNESTDTTYFSNTNYSELLDDLARITQEPNVTTYKESSQTFSRPITHLQIREITIREINATTYSLADAVDEDSGFGEATHEEITEFFNFVGGNSSFIARKSPNKRKSSFESDSIVKQKRYSQVFPNDPDHDEVIAKISPLKRSTTPTKIANTSNQFTYNPANDLPQFHNEHPDYLDLNIKKEPKFKINTELNNPPKIQNHTKKKRHLIIDECTKIDNSIILEDMNNTKMSSKLVRKRILKTFKTKHTLTALELLTRFNRRSSKLNWYKKHKPNVSSEQFEREYLNLLRDMFGRNFNENLASVIFPKWKCFDKALNRKKRERNVVNQGQFVKQPEIAALNNLNDYLNADIMNDNNNNVIMENQQQEIINKDFTFSKEQLNTYANHNWHPYGVMMTLLNLWRLNECNEITANKLFKLADNRIERALGFHSLLNLAKKHFVILTTFPGTIVLQNISMGKAAKKSSNINSCKC